MSSTFFRGVLSCFVTLLVVIDSSNAQACRSYNRQSGYCVSIMQCPPLFQILKRNPSQQELLLLQKLTCGFDSFDDPKVCCPRQLIHPPLNLNRSTEQSTTTTRRTTTPYNFREADPTKGPHANVPQYSPEEILRPSLKSHRNFELLPALKDCSIVISENKERVVGGDPADAGIYPWMARIGYLGPNNDLAYYCGGSVINKRYILTASHCTFAVDGYTPKTIRLGENEVTKNPDCNLEFGICEPVRDYRIEKIIHHPEYNTVTKQNDISLIRVDRDIEFSHFVRPVCLPFFKEFEVESLTLPPGISWNQAIVAGWGKTGKSGKHEGSDKLLDVILPFVSYENCKNVYSKRIIITPNQICAGGIEGKDSCAGDSGGPLVARHTTSRRTRQVKLFQVGIVSYGPVNCGVGGLPGVYARVSQYLQWILDNIEE